MNTKIFFMVFIALFLISTVFAAPSKTGKPIVQQSYPSPVQKMVLQQKQKIDHEQKSPVQQHSMPIVTVPTVQEPVQQQQVPITQKPIQQHEFV